MTVKNQVQLITYPDSLGKNLKELNYVLNNFIVSAIGGIHILPFYPSTYDRGFSPVTHLKVDKKFGNWNDIKKISSKYDLVADLIINHISSESKYFKDYIIKSDKSKYKNLFLKKNDVFNQNISDNIINKIYRPRPTKPFSEYIFSDGSIKEMWTSFTPYQIDLNWKNEITKNLIKKYLMKLIKYGVKIVRLDAVGYIIKEKDTNCFYLPEVYNIIEELTKSIGNKNIKMLPEVHHHYMLQKHIAQKTDLVYDFSLSMIMLYTLYTSNSKRLKEWINLRPNNCITTLDTHDGIGVIDVKDLLSDKEINLTLSFIYKYGGNYVSVASGKSSNNLDTYQINCTYYSALNKNDKAYLCSRVLQLFLPGIPQIYYVGLLAGENDIELLNKTKNGRDINRHYYSIDEISQNIQKPVVQKLINLMKFRNNNDVFNGEFKLHESSDDIIKLSWQNNDNVCILEVDLKNYNYEIKNFSESLQKSQLILYN